MDTEDKVEYELEVVLKDAETLAILCDGGYRLAVGLPRTEDTHFRTKNDRLKITPSSYIYDVTNASDMANL